MGETAIDDPRGELYTVGSRPRPDRRSTCEIASEVRGAVEIGLRPSPDTSPARGLGHRV